MPATKVEFHEKAVEEARAARDWYEVRSPSAAEAFMGELDRVIQFKKHPEGGALYVADTRRYLMKRFPFSVVYRHKENARQVIAVAHSKRKPGYWKDRNR